MAKKEVGERTDLYLVETLSPGEGALLFVGLLFIFNVGAICLMIFSPSDAVREIEFAVLWIGGNQVLYFLAIAGRKRIFELWRRKPQAD